MRASTRRGSFATIATMGLLASLAGCAALLPSATPLDPNPGADSDDTPLTADPIVGWDRDEYTTFGKMDSSAVAAKCPAPWDLVSGQEIFGLQDALSTAEFHVCVFTETPNSTDPNLVDEIAYRVDEGGLALAMAYANYPFGTDEPQCVDGVRAVYALMTTVIDGVTYGVSPGPGWCPSTQPDNQALLDALHLTMVVRDTVGPNG